MRFTGKTGKLRIYDSSDVLHGTAPLDNFAPNVIKFDGVLTYTDITSDVIADDANIVSAFLADTDDAIYVGSDGKFARVKYLGDTNYAAGSGELIAEYYNGTGWTALTGVVDDTSDGTDCFAQDGVVSFKIPKDWTTKGNPNLASDKYYVRFMTTTTPTTDPDADVLCPVDGQYREVVFAAMDFSGAIGRPRTEEQLVLNRGTVDAHAHYVEGGDSRIYDAMEITFSCLLDDAANKALVFTALQCGNVNDGRWTSTGITTKGTTKNDGSNYNPLFVDTTKKTVNVQVLWKGAMYDEGWAYYETYFPDDEQSIAESDEAVTLSCKGGVFGVIERIHGFGNRY